MIVGSRNIIKDQNMSFYKNFQVLGFGLLA